MTAILESPLDGDADTIVAARPRRHRWAWVLLIVTAGLLVISGAVFAYDAATRDELLPGVRIDGRAVGGLTRTEALARFDAAIPAIGAQALRLTADGNERSLTIGDLAFHSDAPAVVERALDDIGEMNVLQRVWHRLLGKPVERAYDVRVRVDRAAARAVVDDLAARVDRPPVDATLDTSSGFVQIVPAVEGRELDRAAATTRLVAFAEDLLNANRAESPRSGAEHELSLPVISHPAAVTSFPHVILVRLGENQLYHYENGVVVNQYAVATGQPQHPTPIGLFRITEKRRNPTWVNPDPAGWGRSMPRRIGPGPSNPLGTRAMNIDAPGIRIHGTRNRASLGFSASHGCVRMAMPDVEELFELVPEGTPVAIVAAGPPRPVPVAPPPASIDHPDVPIDLAAGQQ